MKNEQQKKPIVGVNDSELLLNFFEASRNAPRFSGLPALDHSKLRKTKSDGTSSVDDKTSKEDSMESGSGGDGSTGDGSTNSKDGSEDGNASETSSEMDNGSRFQNCSVSRYQNNDTPPSDHICEHVIEVETESKRDDHYGQTKKRRLSGVLGSGVESESN